MTNHLFNLSRKNQFRDKSFMYVLFVTNFVLLRDKSARIKQKKVKNELKQFKIKKLLFL